MGRRQGKSEAETVCERIAGTGTARTGSEPNQPDGKDRRLPGH